MYKYIMGLLFLFILTDHLYAQETQEKEYYWQRTKEIGLNFTPLVSQLIPFNLSRVDDQIIGFRYKKYYDKAAFKFNLGVNASDLNDENFFHVSLGYEKRRPLAKQFYYTSGWTFLIELVDNQNSFVTEGGIGVSHFYGFEYHINERFFIATEAQLNAIFGSGPVIRFQPPVSIFAFARL